MRCERCKGTGRITRPQPVSYGKMTVVQQIPCPCTDCNGSGIGHCCDGLQCVDTTLVEDNGDNDG